MNPKEEIRLKEIDVQFRLNKYKAQFNSLKLSFESALREKKEFKKIGLWCFKF